MDKENEGFDIMSFLFNNKSFIEGLIENLKKELMEVIFSENLNIFKKSIFIQGVFTYANLILSNNESLSKEEKTKIMEEIVEISNLLADETLEDIKKICKLKNQGLFKTVPNSILYYFFKDSTKTSTSASISSRFTLLVDEVNPTFSFKTAISFT